MNSPKASITLPAASGPVCPSTSTTRVEATFSARRSKVAKRRTVGKEEKSSGLSELIQIITMIRESAMLAVKNRSSKMGGSGITIMTMMQNSTNGIASDDNPGMAKFRQIFDN